MQRGENFSSLTPAARDDGDRVLTRPPSFNVRLLAAQADEGIVSRILKHHLRLGGSARMIIKSRVAFCALAILLPLVHAGCKEQSPAPPASASPSADTASAQPTTQAAGTAASDANASVKGKIDACKLLTADEIKSVQGDALKETKASEQATGPFTTTQCFYATNNFVNSVSLTVTQKNPASSGGESVREFWKERFGREDRHEKDREKRRDKDARRGEEAEEEEEEEEGLPPQRLASVGDDAYSVGNAKIGALYVLKGDKLLRISIGGAHTQPVRTEKMKALAQTAIKRL
jgi:hypothetical protein